MRVLLLIAIGAFLSAGMASAYGQSALSCPSCVQIPYDEIDLYKELFPLIIWTDSQIHNHDSEISIKGFLRTENEAAPVIITVTDPIGNIAAVNQISTGPSGDFEFGVKTSGPTMKKDGDYVIKATSGSDTRVFKTKVTLVSHDLGTVNACSSGEISAVANNGGIYCIPFNLSKGVATGIEGTLDVMAKTLSVNVRSNDISSIVLDIPRHILDSKSGSGEDSAFVVTSFGKMIPHEELEGDSNTRTIKLDLAPVRNGEFEIMGTSVVPEFGSVAAVVLLASISAILILAKTSPRFFPSIKTA